MNSQTVTLIAASLAAATSIWNVLFNYFGARSLERARWEKARADEARKELRVAVAEYAGELAVGVQRATWLAWSVAADPTSLTEKELAKYEDTIRELLPRLLAARLMVAAHDTATYERLEGLTTSFYELDAEMGMAAGLFKRSPADSTRAILALHDRAQQLHRELPVSLAAVMGIARPA